ncbi:hypothetical protein L596_008626 [Steinernema carpocapsae]|nr:hypothetical protein L596_008626 [Steinernema carpocapsae]
MVVETAFQSWTFREQNSLNSQVEKDAAPNMAGDVASEQPKMKLQKVASAQASNGKLLDDEPYYQGFMSAEEAKHLVGVQGEFLVRKADLSSGVSFIISVFWDNEVRHVAILKTKSKGYFYVHKFCFDTVPDLVRYHQQMHVVLDKDVPIQLKTFHERDNWQLYHEQVELGKKLGNGEFGEVFLGKLTSGFFGKPVEVAVKTLKPGSLSVDSRIKFLREANLMLKIRHPNVIRLFGVCTTREPIMIVMEIAPGGSLLDRVRDKQKPLSVAKKVSYLYGVANGMAHLEKELVIHRDLAARNCLIGKRDQAKITDFGLSLSGVTCLEKSQLKKAPIRWLPPETLQRGTYSNKSDVWSYGVVVWEVFNKGRLPYKELGNNKITKQRVVRGYRLTPGDEMNEEMKAVMDACFTADRNQRPTFSDLLKMMKGATPAKKFFLAKLFHSKEKSEAASSEVGSVQKTQDSKKAASVSGSLQKPANSAHGSLQANSGTYTTLTLISEKSVGFP